jgi:hypothetical protein
LFATCCALAVASLAAFAAPAHAGGSAWLPEKTSYSPGELAAARGDFGAGCCDRGWVDDGPYRVWLVAYGEQALTALDLPSTAIPVGELHVERQQYGWAGGVMSKWVASIEFVVPDVPPGPYQLVHCTEPCGRGLGDLMYAFFWVGPAPDFPASDDSPAPAAATSPATTAGPTVPIRAASAATPSSSTSSMWAVPVAAGAAALAFVVVAGAIVVRRLRTR